MLGMASSDSKKKSEDGRIFINYRRTDSKDVAGRLDDTLTRYFGENRVFRDIDDIPKGQSFTDVIKSTLDSTDALIVLIGEKWLTETDGNGTRRVDVKDDHVVMEIEHSLERGTPIYPVLIDDTPMPRPEELPEPIRQLAERNAIHVSYQRWEHDVTRLLR